MSSERSTEREHVVAEIRALRLLLSALETDHAASADVTARTLAEFVDVGDELLDVALVLLEMIAGPILRSDLRDAWLEHLQRRLAILMFGLPVGPMPDTVTDILGAEGSADGVFPENE
jgi:hypothetical protein